MTRRACLGSFLTGCLGVCAGVQGLKAATTSAADVEWHVLFLTNQQRGWRHLSRLTLSEELATVARAHSRDMLARGFFSHQTPEGLDPGDRLARAGLHLDTWGENLYSITDGPTDAAELAALVVAGWMDNRGHRNNILNPDFHRLGVGAAFKGRAAMFTELFAG